MNDHLSRTFKTVLAFLVVVAVCMLCSCAGKTDPTFLQQANQYMYAPTVSQPMSSGRMGAPISGGRHYGAQSFFAE